MNFFEKIFKERFDNAGNLEGIDPDAIWEGISGTIPSATPEVIAPAKAISGLTSYLLGAAGLIAAAGLVFVLTKNETAIDLPDKSEKKETIALMENGVNAAEGLIEKEGSANDVSDIKKQLKETDFAEKDDERKIEKGQAKSTLSKARNVDFELNESHCSNSISAKESFQSPAKGQKNITPNSQANTSDRVTPLRGQRGQFSQSQDLRNDSSESTNISSSEETGIASFEQETSTRKLLTELPELPIKNSFTPSKINLENPSVSITPINKKVRKKNIKIGAFGGATLLANLYQASPSEPGFEQTLKNTHAGVVGYSASAKIYWNPIKKLDVVSGFEYSNTVTKFEQTETLTAKMISRNGLIGPDSVLAREIRRILHFNEQNFISLPILVGTSKQFGKFGIGANAGIGLNLFVSQKGRSLNFENKISTIETATDLPFTKSFLSYQLNPYFNFRATDKMQLQLQSTFRYQTHGMSEFYGLKHNSVLSGLNLGVLITP